MDFPIDKAEKFSLNLEEGLTRKHPEYYGKQKAALECSL